MYTMSTTKYIYVTAFQISQQEPDVYNRSHSLTFFSHHLRVVSTPVFPKVVPALCVLYTLTWKYASRQRGAQIFSFLTWAGDSAPTTSASLLFNPPDPQISVKTQCFATFLPLLRTWIFYLLDSHSSLLCFSSMVVSIVPLIGGSGII